MKEKFLKEVAEFMSEYGCPASTAACMIGMKNYAEFDWYNWIEC